MILEVFSNPNDSMILSNSHAWEANEEGSGSTTWGYTTKNWCWRSAEQQGWSSCSAVPPPRKAGTQLEGVDQILWSTRAISSAQLALTAAHRVSHLLTLLNPSCLGIWGVKPPLSDNPATGACYSWYYAGSKAHTGSVQLWEWEWEQCTWKEPTAKILINLSRKHKNNKKINRCSSTSWDNELWKRICCEFAREKKKKWVGKWMSEGKQEKNPTYQTQKVQPCHSLSAVKPSVSRRWVTYRK